jgi:Zn-dependent protease
MTDNQRTALVLIVLGAIVVTVADISRERWIYFAVLFPSVVLHEVSHGVVALAFGDDTAKRAGRITLNPIAHVDPVGTIVLPLILVLLNGPVFGWAKPVPVSPGRLRNPRQQSLLVSLAGPATNIVLALAVALILRSAAPSVISRELVFEVVFYFGLINVVLATFNLLPVPPLDGSAVVERFLPARWWTGWLRLRQYSFGILLLLVLLFPGVLDRLFEESSELWAQLWDDRFT